MRYILAAQKNIIDFHEKLPVDTRFILPQIYVIVSKDEVQIGMSEEGDSLDYDEMIETLQLLSSHLFILNDRFYNIKNVKPKKIGKLLKSGFKMYQILRVFPNMTYDICEDQLSISLCSGGDYQEISDMNRNIQKLIEHLCYSFNIQKYK